MFCQVFLSRGCGFQAVEKQQLKHCCWVSSVSSTSHVFWSPKSVQTPQYISVCNGNIHGEPKKSPLEKILYLCNCIYNTIPKNCNAHNVCQLAESEAGAVAGENGKSDVNKKAQLSLTNPRDAKACQNCSDSTCLQRCR